MSIALHGFLLGISLILAIGPQNALVLKQGLKRHAVGVVVSVCVISDLILIAAATAGIGVVVDRFPIAMDILRYVGAAYLLWFGYTCFRDARDPKGLDTSDAAATSGWREPALAALFFTWLNPATYVDILVMLGGMANQYPFPEKWFFAAGALLASIVWFPSLGYGAKALSGILAKPRTWQILNVLIGCLMMFLATRLILAG